MSSYSRFNLVYRMQKWMDSVAGQTFMNYAYSWGASIVILGTLFKLTHLPGANIMLFLGMGTEVFVFFISAFDRPFDKTQDGKELPTSRSTIVNNVNEEDDLDYIPVEGESTGTTVIGGTGNGGTIIIGGNGGNANPAVAATTANDAPAVATNAGVQIVGGSQETGSANVAPAAVAVGPVSVPVTPAPAVSPETAAAMELATTTYVDRLNELNELLLKVGAQSERLTKDSEEMENLNRTLTGIAKVYEMQLKSASQQIGTIDEINEKTRRMAQQIEQLNAIYARMVEAMTVNMPGVAPKL